VQSLTEAADAAGELDLRMERLHREALEINHRVIEA
jgi:hypothetical protein